MKKVYLCIAALNCLLLGCVLEDNVNADTEPEGGNG